MENDVESCGWCLGSSLSRFQHWGGMMRNPLACAVRREQYQGRTAEDYYRCLTWLWKPIEMPAALTVKGSA
jgi:hypothetical protein